MAALAKDISVRHGAVRSCSQQTVNKFEVAFVNMNIGSNIGADVPGKLTCKEHIRCMSVKGSESVKVIGQKLKFQKGFLGLKEDASRKLLSQAHAGRRETATVNCSIAGKGGGSGESLPGPEEDDLDSIFIKNNSQSFFHPAFASPSRERDWRAFRSQLVSMEQKTEKRVEEQCREGLKSADKSHVTKGKRRRDVDVWTVASESRERRRWAHAIPEMEKGCILVATELLNGYAFFEKSVIFLLENDGEEAPYALVLNKPLSRKIETVPELDKDLVRVFGSCPINIGGPLDTRKFLFLHGVNGLNGSDEILTGAYCGAMASMDAAISSVGSNISRPEDFRFFFGYTGWDEKQLKKEIEMGWWYVAACSTDIVLKESPDNLWEEVLELMGGKYARLARRDVKET